MSTAHQLDPRARSLWAGLDAVAGALVGAVAGGLVTFLDSGAWVALPGLLMVGAAVGFAWGRARWSRWRWSDLPEALELHRGVIVHRASYVPYHRIQQIDVERGPLERSLGLAQLVVRTASATTDAAVPGLAEDEAVRLRTRLLARAGVDDAV